MSLARRASAATSVLLRSSSAYLLVPRPCWQHQCFQHARACFTTTTTTINSKTSDPLQILFCGSDEFSCASLQALDQERIRNSALVKSIDVVVRPGKLSGRGLKTVREVPLKRLAEDLGLPIHVRDTFTGWSVSGGLSETPPIALYPAFSFFLYFFSLHVCWCVCIRFLY